MGSERQASVAGQIVADAVSGNWVDTRAPARWKPYLRLSRMDRPIGSWLLLLPCWWGLALAILWQGGGGWQEAWIGLGCALGAVLMRGAGCTWNDITDRDIDGRVARTASRPIPSGAVSARAAFGWLVAQCLLAFCILLSFPPLAIALGVGSLALVAIYPFAKRFTWWPQVFLGLAINWGVLLAFAAATGTLARPALAAYAAGIAWTLFYDTIYAHQDAEDDALIGVKSTALLFGDRSRAWLLGFLVATVAALTLAAATAAIGRGPLGLALAAAGAWAMGWHLAWQLMRFDPRDGALLLRLFRSNRDAGLIPLPFFAAAALV